MTTAECVVVLRADMQRLPQKADSLKNAKGELALLRRSVARRVVALTLIVAGIGILLSGIDAAFFH